MKKSRMVGKEQWGGGPKREVCRGRSHPHHWVSPEEIRGTEREETPKRTWGREQLVVEKNRSCGNPRREVGSTKQFHKEDSFAVREGRSPKEPVMRKRFREIIFLMSLLPVMSTSISRIEPFPSR